MPAEDVLMQQIANTMYQKFTGVTSVIPQDGLIVNWSGTFVDGTLIVPDISECNRVEINGYMLGVIHDTFIEADHFLTEDTKLIIQNFSLTFNPSTDTITYNSLRSCELSDTIVINNVVIPITSIKAWKDGYGAAVIVNQTFNNQIQP